MPRPVLTLVLFTLFEDGYWRGLMLAVSYCLHNSMTALHNYNHKSFTNIHRCNEMNCSKDILKNCPNIITASPPEWIAADKNMQHCWLSIRGECYNYCNAIVDVDEHKWVCIRLICLAEDCIHFHVSEALSPGRTEINSPNLNILCAIINPHLERWPTGKGIIMGDNKQLQRIPKKLRQVIWLNYTLLC